MQAKIRLIWDPDLMIGDAASPQTWLQKGLPGIFGILIKGSVRNITVTGSWMTKTTL